MESFVSIELNDSTRFCVPCGIVYLKQEPKFTVFCYPREVDTRLWKYEDSNLVQRNRNTTFDPVDIEIEDLELRNYGKLIPLDNSFMLAIPGTKGKGLLDSFDSKKEKIYNSEIQMIDFIEKKVFYTLKMGPKK